MNKSIAHVDGWPINIATLSDAVQCITDAAGSGKSFSVFTLNLDHLVKLRTDSEFRRAYEAANFVTADGEPVAAMARREAPTVRRTTGADLFEPLCIEAAKHGIPIYLFGSSLSVLEKVSERLKKRTGNKIRIVGYEAPSRNFDPNADDARECLERIDQSGAQLCFVMLGAPKQELLAARAVSLDIKCGFICCGAAGDFIAGHQLRAPKLMQQSGLEWFWRLSRNPARLGTRYLRCMALYAELQLSMTVQKVVAKLGTSQS